MSKKSHNYLIIPFKNYKDFYTNEVIQLVENQTLDIPNKYLYLGYHGARIWDEIDVSYKPGKDGMKLLGKHFKDIDAEIRAHSKAYDIVSLGCGSGEDDILILKEIQRCFTKKEIPDFKIFTIDLSDDLLEHGTHKITQFVNHNAATRLNKSIEGIWGIWADFNDLSAKKDYLDQNFEFSKRNKLFHLLGLTIGNNNEIDILRWLYNFMNKGDYLLIGVDFSVDGDIDSAFNEYTEGDASEAINRFLCGPLLFTSEYYFDSNPNELIHKIHFPKVKIEHKQKDDRQVSKVKGAVSFTRYHHYANGTPRLCDFSTKYKSEEFDKFLNETLFLEDIYFEVVFSNLGLPDSEESSQSFVLLKKNIYATESGDINDEQILNRIKTFIINKLKISLNEHNENQKQKLLAKALTKLENCNDLSILEEIKKILKEDEAIKVDSLHNIISKL